MAERENNTRRSQSKKAERAAALSEILLSGIENNEREYRPEKLDIYFADIESNVDKFSQLYRIFSRRGLPFPCLKFPNDDPIPIDLGLGFGFFKEDILDHPFLYDLFHPFTGFNITENIFRHSPVISDDFSPAEAKGFFKNRLERFILSRLRKPRTVNSNYPGVSFEVSTKTQGVRVHYSPAYFFNPSLVFGSPTSPVKGLIQPGRYIFGVAGQGINKPQFSSAEFDIPPRTHADLEEL